MANDEISDIANSVALGDNVLKGVIAAESSIKAGHGMYYSNTTGVKRIDGAANAMSGCAGVMKEHYSTGIDTALTDGQAYQLVTEGYVAVFCDDPVSVQPEGSYLHGSGAAAGSFGWLNSNTFISASGYKAVIKTTESTANGATVTRGRLI